MKRISTFAVVMLFAVLTGCAGTSLRVNAPYQPNPSQKFTYEIVGKDKMSDEAHNIFRERLASKLVESGLLAANNDGGARSVQIIVDNYYMRHGAARAMAGIMAGADNILTSVLVKEAKGGRVLAKFEVESKNPSAWGTSRGLIEDHADKVVSYLKSGQQ